MSLPQERRAAALLLIGVLAPLIIMGMHPTGGDLATGGARLVLINHVVHGVSLAAQPIVFVGLLGQCRAAADYLDGHLGAALAVCRIQPCTMCLVPHPLRARGYSAGRRRGSRTGPRIPA